MGKVLSRKGKFPIILKPGVSSTGYYLVSLSRNGIGNTLKVHRLVMKAFTLNPLNKPYVNHKDGNKLNNNIENLEWCTHTENAQHMIYVLGILPGTRRDITATEIKCNRCGRVLPIDQFYIRVNKLTLGRCGSCKECECKRAAARSSEYYYHRGGKELSYLRHHKQLKEPTTHDHQ